MKPMNFLRGDKFLITQNEFLELCSVGTYEEVSEAIHSGIDPDEHGTVYGTSVSPIFVAVAEGNDDALRALLENGAECSDGFTAAILAGKMDSVKKIVKAGGDINSTNKDGRNALLSAVMSNNTEAVNLLISLGADVNAKDFKGTNIMTYAAAITNPGKDKKDPDSELDPEIIAALFRKCTDYEEAFVFAVRAGNEKFLRVIIDNGADVNMRDSEGRTVLMYSVMTGGGALRLLLESGADPNIPDDSGRTPLMIASIAEEPDFDIINMLLEFGAKIDAQDKKGLTALMWASAGVDMQPNILLQALIRTGAVRAKGGDSWCAFSSLYAAVKHEAQIEVVRMLVRNGADVNITDRRGMNALMYAMMNNDDETADILTEAGAQINFDLR